MNPVCTSFCNAPMALTICSTLATMLVLTSALRPPSACVTPPVTPERSEGIALPNAENVPEKLVGSETLGSPTPDSAELNELNCGSCPCANAVNCVDAAESLPTCPASCDVSALPLRADSICSKIVAILSAPE